MESIKICLLVQLCWSMVLLPSECQQQRSTYKAAVVEYQSLPFNEDPVENMLDNVKVYAEKARLAAEQDADLIMFPEYGLIGLGDSPASWDNKSDEIFLDLPKTADGTVPCFSEPKSSEQNKNYQILRELSCIANNNSIALIVNQLIRESCDPALVPKCPSRGYFQFNTNIIFSKNGTILGRYHKRHLFEESMLNPAPEPEFEIVDLGFAKFGTFICFDIMYADPAVQYVTQHGIKNLLFSTAWIDELPYLTSAQLFTRFARGLGINLMVSNAYNPPIARLGSGIYSSQLGGVNESYDLAAPGRVIIAELPVDPEPVPSDTFSCTFNSVNIPQPLSPGSSNDTRYVPYVITDVPSSSKDVNKTHKIYYQALSNFTYLFLSDDSGQKTVCEGDLCCSLDYEIDNPNGTVYALALRNGIHPFSVYRMYMQVCSVLRCESEDIETCGRVPERDTLAQFENLTLTGTFATADVYPSILDTDLLAVASRDWSFSTGPCGKQSFFKSGATISLKNRISKPILVASIYGRVFERDQEPVEPKD